MKNKTVRPGEKISMSSETGEWIVNTYFYDKLLCEEWKKSGNGSILGKEIGKFSEDSCVRGKYKWMFNNDFEIIYDKNEKTATFSKN